MRVPPKRTVKNWTRLVFDYLRGRPNLRRVYVLIDARHGLKDNDIEALTLLDKAAVSYQIVLTKADKLKAGGACGSRRRDPRGNRQAAGRPSRGHRHLGRHGNRHRRSAGRDRGARSLNSPPCRPGRSAAESRTLTRMRRLDSVPHSSRGSGSPLRFARNDKVAEAYRNAPPAFVRSSQRRYRTGPCRGSADGRQARSGNPGRGRPRAADFGRAALYAAATTARSWS